MERKVILGEVTRRLTEAQTAGDELAVAAYVSLLSAYTYINRLEQVPDPTEGVVSVGAQGESQGYMMWDNSAVRWNPEEGIFDRNGTRIHLPSGHISNLMDYLASSAGSYVDRRTLCELLYGRVDEGVRKRLSFIIWKLRSHIEPDPSNPVLIVSPTGQRGQKILQRVMFNPQGISQVEK